MTPFDPKQFRDEPQDDAELPTRKAPAYINATEFIQEIEGMLFDGEYSWAYETLDGIRDTVSHTEEVTDRQWEAVQNIRRAGEGRKARAEGGRSRRYEGFRR